MTQQNFILIGRSGCGKGTQGKLLMEYLKKTDPARNVMYVQTGGEFRKFIEGDSLTQKNSKEIYDKGGLQPEFLAVYMWTKFFVDNYKGDENIIIDGTPRKLYEARTLESMWSFYKISNPTVIYLKVSKEWSIDKLLARGRFDDTEKDIETRLSWFETDVVSTIEYYKNNSLYNFFEVNGEQEIEKVWQELESKLKTI
ncbi:MAG: nucleoside monophosphate kinase [Patescibacteria group bacterium]|nr:nucleoside monophosphate kinase [Patescibacteria group bacterium]